MDPKQQAGDAAVEYVKNGMTVGLGTGSTAVCFIRALGAAVAAGRVRDIRAVPTSIAAQRLASSLSIPLASWADVDTCDVTVDGADEIAPGLALIKGRGGALLREKIVAQNSRRLIIVADSSKRVDVLGTRGPLPVEVTTFAHQASARFLQALGCEPVLRVKATNGDSEPAGPFVTDNGNYIYDCRFTRIDNPSALAAALSGRAGIVEHGLFLNIADTALVCDGRGVLTLTR